MEGPLSGDSLPPVPVKPSCQKGHIPNISPVAATSQLLTRTFSLEYLVLSDPSRLSQSGEV